MQNKEHEAIPTIPRPILRTRYRLSWWNVGTEQWVEIEMEPNFDHIKAWMEGLEKRGLHYELIAMEERIEVARNEELRLLLSQ